VTNARFAALHGLPVALLPCDDARSAPQTRALVTSGILHAQRKIRGAPVGNLPSALRLRGFTQFVSPPSPPLARRQIPTEAGM